MATASTQQASGTSGKERMPGRGTSHLKMVPDTRELRAQLRGRCTDVAARLDKSHPLTKHEMQHISRGILDEMGLAEGHVGWTMVNLASEFWREQIAAVPYSRRLLLLPHCLKHAESCPAEYDEFGLDCQSCGGCAIADFRDTAERLGYRVLVAEGSPIVMKIILGGHVDAILGVACLNVLEKAIDKVLLAGIPCMAVPLLSNNCHNSAVDEDWVAEMINLERQPTTARTRSYIHLLRTARGMFADDQLARLAPPVRSGFRSGPSGDNSLPQSDPIGCTELLARNFLAKGGKYSRPFITLAAYDALTGARGTQSDGDASCREFSDAVRRTAMSIETFHKASLVHDDIEDNDQYRYGDETLHRKFGTATAINVGDYLIGLGYRLVSRETESLGHEVVADILNILADAHLRLSEGQGAELMWRDARQGELTPLDALKIYALKTAPAFEAAVLCGLRLAEPIEDYARPVSQFARHLGVAFQILNDLKDWSVDDDNKLTAGGDVLGGRPTLLLALALDGLPDSQRGQLVRLVKQPDAGDAAISEVRRLYQNAGVFDKAQQLVDKHRERAQAVADQLEPEALRRLFHYLIDTVLDGSEPTRLSGNQDVVRTSGPS